MLTSVFKILSSYDDVKIKADYVLVVPIFLHGNGKLRKKYSALYVKFTILLPGICRCVGAIHRKINCALAMKIF